MLRPDGNCGEIREGYLVSLPHCTVNTEKAWRGEGDVSQGFIGSARPILSGRQIESGFKDLHRRRWLGATAVLDAFPRFNQVHDIASTSNSASVGRRGWGNVGLVDEAEKAGANWVKMLASLAATGTTGRTPVLGARTGTTQHRTRTTTSGLASSVSAPLYRFANATALRADQSKCGQPVLSSLGKYTNGFGRTPSRKSKGGADFMPKRHRHLIDQIITMDNLRDAYYKTSKGKKMTWGYLEFKEYAESNLLLVQQELADGAYAIGKYREFTIYEPKPRLISALDFKDRLVQHALCNVISPIFEKTLMPYTFACRVGLGTHAGVRHVQARMRSTHASHFLKTDFSKFFPSVDRQVLHEMIDRRIGCEKTLNILREIIPQDGTGIPIGSLTSQLFANVYGNPVDRFIHFRLGHHDWARYMDDIVILDKDPARLRDSFQAISEFAGENMKLRISKWSVGSLAQGVNFLGYRIWHDYKLLRKDSVVRAKKKVSKFVKHNDTESLRKFIASWSGHAQWANTHNLFTWMEKQYGITV
jgi:retron-type reverse transcriptase